MILGAVLILMALLLLIHNSRESDMAGKYAMELFTDVYAAIEENIQNAEDNSVITEHINQYDEVAVELAQEITITQIDGSGYIGYITIPKLELELPICSELDDEALKRTPCCMSGSYKTNDLIIAGHNYKQHFGRLKLLKPDDIICFTDMNGTTTIYTVSEIEVLGGYQVEEMLSGEWDLTLFTCTYSGQERLTVRCERYIAEY